MGFKVADIPPEGLTVELSEKIDLFDKDSAETGFTADLSIKTRGGGRVHISGRIKSVPELQCSRCLKMFPFAVETAIDLDLLPVNALNAEGSEHELGKAELNTEFYRGDEIEPKEIVREHILLALPMVPLHDEQCKGLCSVCGTDLNAGSCTCGREGWQQEGAFSALKNMFKK